MPDRPAASARRRARSAASSRMRLSRAFEMPMRAMPVRSLPSRNLAIVPARVDLADQVLRRHPTSSKNTSFTSQPPSMVWIGRTVMPGGLISASRNDMPSCFFTAGSVRASRKIQSACWASVVQVFCPLMTQLVAAPFGAGGRPARSEPAPGSEKPWHHQSSRLAARGRKRRFCASVPNAAMHRADHGGVERQRRRHAGLLHLVLLHDRAAPATSPARPIARGQCGTAQRCAFRMRCAATISGLSQGSPARPLARIGSGTAVRKNCRAVSRKAISSAVKPRSIGPFPSV